MKEQPQLTVSVVIPTFNRARVLPRAIRSVFAQTFSEWEIIVVDDASSDQTEQLMKDFSDVRIRYIRQQHNRGPSAARNTGIQAARGMYFAFLDSDDEWLPEKIAHDVSVFNSAGDGVGLVYSGEMFLGPDGRQVRNLPTLKGRAYDRLLLHDFIGSCSRVSVRRNALEIVGGFDEKLTNEEDWDLWLRIAKVFDIGLVPECLVRRHYGCDQITGNPGSLKRIYEGRARIVEKHREQMPRAVLAGHLAMLAGLLLNYDMPHARRLGFEALRLKMFQPRLLGALIISLFGVATYRYLFSQFARLRHRLYMGRTRA